MAAKKCFVIMPFGEKPDVDGTQLDFDEVYARVIKPPVDEAELECVRCDEIGRAGWIHGEMINLVYSADVAVVDITTLNANVFYELGIRHALRQWVTVLIKRKGTTAPFNIHGLNVIEYDMDDVASIQRAKTKLSNFVAAGMRDGKSDSLVHKVLDLRITDAPSRVLKKTETSYRLKCQRGKTICIVTGDIQNIRGVDIWVNSENTNMQMARFFDRSVSSVIRYLGAEKDAAEQVTKDWVADDLAKKVGTHNQVNPGSVIVTTSGELAETHGVKRIFHVAAVRGAGVGRGYEPISNMPACVSNALKKADSRECAHDPPRSILFPLMGTGTARGDLRGIVGELIEAAIDYLRENPESTIERVCFVTWSDAGLLACQRFLDGCAVVERVADGQPPDE